MKSGEKWFLEPEKWVTLMFFGEYNHNLDAKGRMSLPAKFREHLSDVFYLTRGLDNCLYVYPEAEWRVIEEKLKALPTTSKTARAYKRLFFSGASQVSFDKQGRIMIPSVLREHAHLDKETVVIGVSTHIEIWSQEQWLAYNDDATLSYEDIAEEISSLGI